MPPAMPTIIGARQLTLAAFQLDVRRVGGCSHGDSTVARPDHPMPLVIAKQHPLAAGPVGPPMRPMEAAPALAITQPKVAASALVVLRSAAPSRWVIAGSRAPGGLT